MSEKTVLIATEGRSDFVFFETLIAKLAKEKKSEVYSYNASSRI